MVRGKAVQRQIFLFLVVVLLAGSMDTATLMAEPISENSVQIRKNTYIDVEDETLEEDRYGSKTSYSVEQEGVGTTNIPSAYRSDQVSANGTIVSYLPDSFRNQGSYGTCWSFSALGACEASLIRKGIETGSIDLSERHLIYYFYNKGEMADPKGGGFGDYNIVNPSDAPYLDQGGNSTYTMWHLVSWCGPVAETMAPYSGLNSLTTDAGGLMGKSNSVTDAYLSDACHVQNVYKVALGDTGEQFEQKQTVKKLIMEYGGLGISYYSSSAYDSPEYDSYYNPDKTTTNHAVMVIGWDDDFPKENFVTEAPGDGAWLIRNSWGDDADYSAQNGSFWLSYYDASVNGYVDTNGKVNMRYAYVYDAEPADNYDHIYQYDADSVWGTVAFQDAGKVSNRFTITNAAAGQETVKAVGIGVAQDNVSGTLEIYTNLTNSEGDPTAGTKVLSQDFLLEYAGYHTIPLSEGIVVADGQQFTAVFTFRQRTVLNVSYDYDASAAFVNFITYENPGVSTYQSSAETWDDLTDYGWILRIKAYTDDPDAGTPVTPVVPVNPTPPITPVTPVNPTPPATPVTPVNPTPPAAPEKMGKTTFTSISLTKAGKACLKWKKVSGASGYQIFRATSEKGKYKCVKTVTGLTATLPSHSGNKPYYYKVRAYKSVDGVRTFGEFSAVRSCAPKTPSSVRTKAQAGRKIKVTWKKVSNATGYEVYRATSKGGTYRRVKTVTSRKTVSFTDKSLKRGRRYYYKVRAYRVIKGKKVYGNWSGVVAVKAK